MKTTGKWIMRIVVTIAILIVIGIVVFLVAGNQIIKSSVEKGATSALNVRVELDDVSVHPLAGKVEMQNLVVYNPQGYSIPTLMKLGEGRVAVKLGSLMSDTVDIDYIILDNIDLSIEQKGLSTNLNDLLKNMPKSPEEAEQKAPGKKLRIKTLEINNVNVTVKLLPIPGKMNKVTLKLAPIKMTDLGSDSKLDMAALSSKILAAIAQGVAQQGTDLLPGDITGQLKSGLSQMKGMLKGVAPIGEGAVEAGRGIIEQGGKAGKDILNIFKKDANKP